MPIRNESQVTYLDQAEIDSGDISVMERIAAGYWLISGGEVTAQGTADGTVAVAAGSSRAGGSNKTITAGNVSVLAGSANPDGTTATAADATLARIDLIVLNGSSQLGVLHGTNAGLSPNNDGSYLCEWPTSTNYLVLAAVFIPPNAAVVTTSMIESKRIGGTPDAFHDQAHSIVSTTAHTAGWGGKGYLVVGTAAGTASTLAAGTNGQIIQYQSGQTTGLLPINLFTPVTFSRPGTLAVTTEATVPPDAALPWYNDTGRTLTIASARASLKTVNTGATAIFDLNVDGTTTMTGTKIEIAASASPATTKQTTFSTTTIADGSYLSTNVDQIGSTIAGAGLTLTVFLKG